MRASLMVRVLVVVFFAFGLLANASHAQSTNATVGGQITDEQGRVVPGVTVVLTNLNTGVPYEAKTNGDGLYNAPLLPPGIYRANVTKDGFKSIVKGDIELHVQDVASINFQLQIGSVNETVTVQGGAPLINTEDAAVSTVIDRQFVENIPLNGQSFNTLMQLVPGTVIVPASSQAPGQFSINGQRTNANYFQVDGVGANFGASNQSTVGQGGGGGTQAFNAYGGTASLVSVDALQEFRVETSSFSPEYGRTPGGQVSITTRSGTNEFHGDVFDYFRNTVLDANNWFANRAALPRAPEHQNDFGGVFGGPIFRDKTFFFVSYEGLRLHQPQTQLIEVPSLSLRQSAIPAAAAVLNAYPLPDPNGPISPDGTLAQFTGNYSNQISMNAGSVRVDQIINSRWNLFGRFNYSPSQLITRIASLSTLQNQPADTTTFTLGVNGQLTTNVTNALRFNYSTQTVGQTWQLDSFGGAVPLSPRSLVPSPFSLSDSNAHFTAAAVGLPSLQVGTNASNSVSQWAVVDDVSILKGTHEIKVGVAYNRLQPTGVGQAFGPQYLIQSAQQLQQFTSNGTVSNFENFVGNSWRIVFNELSGYAQDRWRSSERLTLTYGLRWEFNPPPSGQNTVLASWQNTNDPANLALAPVGTSIWKTRYTDFAPRLGFAYRITPKGDFVLRGGTGVFYDLGTGIAPTLGSQFPNGAFFTDFSGSNSYPLPIANVGAVTPSFSLAPPYTGNMTGFSQGLRLPYSYQWNVAVEKSFGSSQSLSLTYLGQVGRRLIRQEILPTPNPNFATQFSLTENGDSSNYNALQVQYRRAMSRGLQVLLNYTWSHSIDTNSGDTIQPVSSSFAPVAGDRGSSDFDVRQNFTGAFTYAVPSFRKNVVLHKISEGWALSGFVLARSGSPIGIRTFAFGPGGVLIVRPDLVLGQPIWIDQAGAAGGRILNPNAFAIHPFALRQGTLPRNIIYGFGATQFDTSVQRNFNFSERMRLQFRADIFNVFNHANFTNPEGVFFDGLTPQFGMSISTLNQGLSNGAGLNPLYSIGGPRSIQLSLKLFF